MDALVSLLSQIAPQHWLALGLILLIAELASGTTYLLWPAVAAGLTAVVGLIPGVAWGAEIALFAVLVIALTAFGRPLVRNWMKNDTGHLNERGAALIGAQGAAADTFVNGVGSVKVNDTVWRAVSDAPIAAGAIVQVLGVDGVTLRVKAV